MSTTTTTSGTPKQLIEGRIPILPFRVCVVITFAITISTVICRLIALVPQKKKIRLDDVFLIFATIFLIAGTVLLFIGLDDIYFVENLSLNGLASVIGLPDGKDWLSKLIFYQKINWSYLALTWSSIFFVKFSFLAFFADLCNRLPRIELYRKIVFGFCFLVFIFAVADGFASCPQLGLDALQCARPENIQKNLAIGTVAITLDMVTDIMILIIPITLLWKVKLRTFQKLAIGIFLCLSVVMILLAIVRTSGVHYHGITDNSWIYFWQQIEASAAVTMISLTAFRSVFVPNAQKRSKYSPWEASIPKFIRKMRRSSINSDDLNLNHVEVPGATMTGMRTFIGRGDEYYDNLPHGEVGIAKTTHHTVQSYLPVHEEKDEDVEAQQPVVSEQPVMSQQPPRGLPAVQPMPQRPRNALRSYRITRETPSDTTQESVNRF